MCLLAIRCGSRQVTSGSGTAAARTRPTSTTSSSRRPPRSKASTAPCALTSSTCTKSRGPAERLDTPLTGEYFSLSNAAATKANPAKAGGTKPRVLASSATLKQSTPRRTHDRRATASVSSAVAFSQEANAFVRKENRPMRNRNGRLMSVADFRAELVRAPKTLFAVAGDERLLAQLPRGNWIGGTIPYLMTDEDGGLTTRDSLMVQELLTDERAAPRIAVYDADTIARVTQDAPPNGYTFLMLPAFSDVHLAYGKDAPHFKDLFAHPIIGWVTGIHLNDLGKETPKVFNGKTGEVFADQAIACHVSLPAGKTADVEIVNIFERSEGPDIRFETDGFGPVTDCWIDGKKTNFARWLTDTKVDTQLPLIADYNGALINVSIQGVDAKAGTVSLYAPVFKDKTYRLAKPMPDYVQGFGSVTAGPTHDVAFACNCTLNYVYGKLDGARVGLPGPFTLGEIGYQLLNQTMVYCDVVDAAVPHEGGRYFAQQMSTAR